MLAAMVMVPSVPPKQEILVWPLTEAIGVEVTVNALIAAAGLPHPELIVYVILVVPVLLVVTSPPVPTSATEVLLLLQVPEAELPEIV